MPNALSLIASGDMHIQCDGVSHQGICTFATSIGRPCKFDAVLGAKVTHSEGQLAVVQMAEPKGTGMTGMRRDFFWDQHAVSEMASCRCNANGAVKRCGSCMVPYFWHVQPCRLRFSWQ